MILQALKTYYDRLASDPSSGIAPEGWALVAIPFVLVIDEEGTLVQIEDTREGDGKKKRAKVFLVPQGAKKTSGVRANLLWDTSIYVTGCSNLVGVKDDLVEKVVTKAAEKHGAFFKLVEETLESSTKKQACLAFLGSVNGIDFSQFDAWKDILETDPVVAIRFASDLHLYCQDQEVKKVIASLWNTSEEEKRVCLITGELDNPSTLHTSIKGVMGAQTSGANIVSFNLRPFRSYGKEQGDNAPVGKAAMFAYTTALNQLLSRQSKQKIQVGDASTVFWAEKTCQFETDFASIFSEPSKDDPNANTQCIRSLLEAPKTGEYYTEAQDFEFFVLGLAPNAARLSVRFWFTGTVKFFAANIRQHFEDLAIVKPTYEQEYYSLWRLLLQMAVQGKTENIPPNISGDLMKAILQGTAYPQSLLQGVLRRIRSDAEQRITPIRAALIKAYINRYYRNHPRMDEKELEMALDTNQTSVGYQLGRLMATLGKIQEEASPNINATVTDRYYGAACTTPVAVFGTLMRSVRHHLDKLESTGRKIYFEQLMGEIISHVSEFPAHLDLHEQGRFAVGFYHQRQAFFTKNTTEE